MPEAESGSPPVILTGATGFIGRRLQLTLSAQGIRVRALVRPASIGSVDLARSTEVVACELGGQHTTVLEQALTGARAIVYCAGTVRGRHFRDFSPANVDGLKAVAEVANSLTRPPPILLISSLAASRPGLSHYARSKHQGEQVLRGYASVTWTIFRPAAVYGPGERDVKQILDWARRGIMPVPGPRGQRVSLLHVDDLCNAVIAWIENPESFRHRSFELGDAKTDGYGWPDIAAAAGSGNTRLIYLPGNALSLLARTNEWFSSLLGYAPMLTFGKVRELTQASWVADHRPFSEISDWRPGIDLSQGIRSLYGNSADGEEQ